MGENLVFHSKGKHRLRVFENKVYTSTLLFTLHNVTQMWYRSSDNALLFHWVTNQVCGLPVDEP